MEIPEESKVWDKEYIEELEAFNFNKAVSGVFAKMQGLDEEIQNTQPFKLVKTDPPKGKEIIKNLVMGLRGIAQHLEPFLPETARKIIEAVEKNKMPEVPLFLRKD